MRRFEIEFILEELEYELSGLTDGDQHSADNADKINDLCESIQYYNELLTNSEE